MRRLNRTRLLFGEAATKKIQDTTVMVVGCGAVGSFAAEALARTGVGHIILVDFDCIEESNINRQLYALDSTVGRPKVDVALSRIHDINPGIRVDALKMFFDSSFDLDIMPDYIIDAIDTVESKVALYHWASSRNIPFISSMGAAGKTDPTMVRISRISQTCVCPLASRVRRMIRGSGLPDFPVAFSSQQVVSATGHAKNLGSVITVTGTFGLVLANWVIMSVVKDNSF